MLAAGQFAALYDQHVRLVRSILYRVCPRASLDDLTQEVFLRAWRGRAGFRGASSPRTWLGSIARNVAIDALRKGDQSQTHSQSHSQSTSGLREERDDGATQGEPNVTVAGAHESALAKEVLLRLDPDERLLLVLLVVEEFTNEEAGEILGIPVGTVKSRAFALRRRLQERLGVQGAA